MGVISGVGLCNSILTIMYCHGFDRIGGFVVYFRYSHQSRAGDLCTGSSKLRQYEVFQALEWTNSS